MSEITSNIRKVTKVVEHSITQLDKNAEKTRDEMMSALIQLAKEEVNKKRQVVGTTRSGNKIYAKAEPDKPPQKRTGTLQRSITGKKDREGFGTYTAVVGPGIIYGRRLELGGGNWKQGIKFPYMQPAFKKFKPIASQIIARNLRIK